MFIIIEIIYLFSKFLYLETPSNNTRRGLVLISKIIQRLALREGFPPDKEPYMCEFNEIIESYSNQFDDFAKKLIV